MRRFTPEQKASIVQLYKDGIKIESIMVRFNCSKSYPGILAGRAGVPLRMSWVHRERMMDAARERSLRRLP